MIVRAKSPYFKVTSEDPAPLPGVAASANGMAGIFGYASTTVSGLAFGILADKLGWNSVFEVTIAIGILGVILFATIWNAPANGYAKAEPILLVPERCIGGVPVFKV